MHDVAIQAPAGLTAAEGAVAYLVQRLKADADLRHHMLHTEAMAWLFAAESLRTGTPAEAMEAEIIDRAIEQEPAQLLQCRRALTEIYNLAADCLERGGTRAAEALRKIQDKTESLRS